MPIPGSKSEQMLANKVRYEDLKIKPNYLPGIRATNLRDIVFAKELGYSRRTKEEVTSNFAHFDPWMSLIPREIICLEKNRHKCVFRTKSAGLSE